MSTADACDREAAWLSTSGDGLPALLKTAGGPWAVVQAYLPRTARTQLPSIFVTRERVEDYRPEAQRIRPRYNFKDKCVWPVRATTAQMLESEQRAFDAALDLLVQRIRGPVGDKSHGGRFLSAGEVPGRPPGIAVQYEDPERTMPADKELCAWVLYSADDYELSG